MRSHLLICLRAAVIATSLLPGIACALDFRVSHINPFTRQEDNIQYLVLEGEIRPGDHDRLLRYVLDNHLNILAMPVVLNSPGGDVSEAVAIGHLIKGIYAQVGVGPAYGRCASSCFIIAASSINRWIEPGMLGIHRPYLSKDRMRTLAPTDAETAENRAMASAENYLRSLR